MTLHLIEFSEAVGMWRALDDYTRWMIFYCHCLLAGFGEGLLGLLAVYTLAKLLS
jgi:hypothetical protein